MPAKYKTMTIRCNNDFELMLDWKHPLDSIRLYEKRGGAVMGYLYGVPMSPTAVRKLGEACELASEQFEDMQREAKNAPKIRKVKK